MSVAAVIVAAGRGERAGGVVPKQYSTLGGEAMVVRALKAFATHDRVAHVLAICNPEHFKLYDDITEAVSAKILTRIAGGATRQQSVLAGLERLVSINPQFVLIHDAARPFVSTQVIDRVLDALPNHVGAIAAVPVADTLKRAEAGRITATLPRGGLWSAQTPQGFRFQSILDAHRRAAAAGISGLTDDSAVAEWAGIEVAVVEGAVENRKVTTADDLAAAHRDLARPVSLEPRTGLGFDIHRFAEGNIVWLCGVAIPHTHRLDGHSDADVCLHALTDALLGTIGAGDIGDHFPPSDPQWRGTPSHIFLEDAARRVAAAGGRISNVDITILCERPKIAPHRDAMRASIADLLRISAGRVGVKATTMERLGAIGRDEGIAAMAVASVLLPAGD